MVGIETLSIYTIVIVCVIIALWMFKRWSNDPYGSYNLTLNVHPESGSRQKPEWLNMGYWENVNTFPDACEALALKVIQQANCVPDGCVLDVGHACGDSLLLYLRHPSIPRPAVLYGVTSLSGHYSRSLKRTSQVVSQCKVHLFCGDAVFRPHHHHHPLKPNSPAPQLTSITAIDCAYHFASRELFLQQSYTRLAPGGTIALADLIVSQPLPFLLRMFLSRLLSFRSENMVTSDVYEAQLKKIGYVDIHIEDVSQNVFPGFRNFLASRGGAWGLVGAVIGWWASAGGRFVIVSASKPESLTKSWH